MKTVEADFDRAVVIGASMSGLLAARALAQHFKEVIVIERDAIPPGGQPRKSVPQGRHAHVLLARGCQQIEAFFPGLTADLVAQGAVAGDLSEDGIWYAFGVRQSPYRSGLTALQVTRPLLEGYIYGRLCAIPNVSVRVNCDVSGLTSEQGPREVTITGVKVSDRSGGGADEILPANLVVDAGGRGSRSPAWLESLGYPRPPEDHIKMALSYTTFVYPRLPEHTHGKSPLLIGAGVQTRRGGAMLAVEGQRWLVTLFGYLGDSAPPDEAGFVEYARTLDAPDIYNILKTTHPLGEPSQYKYPASQRRRYEKLARFPQRLVVCGDALCSFNPVYGQGMTTAAGEAVLLGECLQAGLDRIGPRFFKRASRLLNAPWDISAGGDLAFSEVEGKRSLLMTLSNRYVAHINRLSPRDTVLALAFFRVTNLVAPPASLFYPSALLRVLLDSIIF